MRITIVAIALVWAVVSSTFVVHPSPTITTSGISTGFEASEGYTVGSLDDQNGWEHAQLPGSWQVETDVKHLGAQAVRSPSGFDDTEARGMTKPFPAEDIGDMVFYMRRDDTNYQHNNFNVGFNTVSGEDPGVKQICVVGMGDEGIVMQNDTGGTAFLSDLNAGEWYKIHFKWDASICQEA